MNTQQDETLSAFVDDELQHGAEQAELSTRLLRDRAFRQKMARYRQIGEVMRSQPRAPVDASDLIDRIQADLAQEPHLLVRKTRTLSSRRVVRGGALAAAVAVAAIIYAPQLFNPDNPVSLQQRVAQEQAPRLNAPQGVLVVAPSANRLNNPVAGAPQWKRLPIEQLQRLDRYMVEHNEYANSVRLGRPSAHVNFVAVKNAAR